MKMILPFISALILEIIMIYSKGEDSQIIRKKY